MANGDPPGTNEEDSSQRFCDDFRRLMNDRGATLRSAASNSHWGKSTIATARQGPALPRLDLVLDVLAAIGEPSEDLELWRARHQRLDGSQPSPLDAGDAGATSPGASMGPATERPSEQSPQSRTRRRGWQSKRVLVAVGVSLLLIAATAWVLTRRSDDDRPGRMIVIQNEVAVGPSDLREDTSPSYLAARPIRRCANVAGCKLTGTNLDTGDTVEAVCQLQGALLTNADVSSAGIKSNPNIAASTLWYGIRWHDGRRGYLSEVYVAAMYRGGLQLPPC